MELKKRKINRLKGFDYSTDGAYFVTICTKDRKCTLAKIVGDGSPIPKKCMLGEIATRYIESISEKYPTAYVDKYVVMPNHIHLVLFINNSVIGAGNPSPTLGNIIGWLKYSITKEYNKMRVEKISAFQRSYYDHIIRNEKDYLEILQYIENNPMKWKMDELYNQPNL